MFRYVTILLTLLATFFIGAETQTNPSVSVCPGNCTCATCYGQPYYGQYINTNVLFVEPYLYSEYLIATDPHGLNLTATVITQAAWMNYKTQDFSYYLAIIIGDPNSHDPSGLAFFNASKSVWGPAINGNIMLISASPFSEPALIKGAIQFVSTGFLTTGYASTGLYFPLSRYYEGPLANLDYMSYFDKITVGCVIPGKQYGKGHLVASFPPAQPSYPLLGPFAGKTPSPKPSYAPTYNLVDSQLNVNGTVHNMAPSSFELYTNTYSTFQPFAISLDSIGEYGDGSFDGNTPAELATLNHSPYADGTLGNAWILSRGATPLGCGDGYLNPTYGEECDDGNTLNGDGCNQSCKCENKLGTCVGYTRKERRDVVEVEERPLEPPAVIGVEIITYITVTNILNIEGSITKTRQSTSAYSTTQREVWNTRGEGVPCYSCIMSYLRIRYPEESSITVFTTTCTGSIKPTGTIHAVVQTCDTCSLLTLDTAAVPSPRPLNITPISEQFFLEEDSADSATTETPDTDGTSLDTSNPISAPQQSAPLGEVL